MMTMEKNNSKKEKNLTSKRKLIEIKQVVTEWWMIQKEINKNLPGKNTNINTKNRTKFLNILKTDMSGKFMAQSAYSKISEREQKHGQKI